MQKDMKKIPDFLIKLMEGCSTYTKASNQYWIALAFFCLVTIAPSINKENLMEMPFGLGKFRPPDFYLLAFFVNAILVICFGSAFSQAIRARKLIQRAVDRLKRNYIFDGPVFLQDAVDVILYPAFNRVAPLAQALQAKSQFFPEALQVPRSQRLLAYGYYLFLKTLATAILYGFPGWALGVSFYHSLLYMAPGWAIAKVFIWLMAVLTGIILVQLSLGDVVYAVRVSKRIFSGKNG
jgi:hypothetical protein